RKRSQRCDPINPAAPVINTLFNTFMPVKTSNEDCKDIDNEAFFRDSRTDYTHLSHSLDRTDNFAQQNAVSGILLRFPVAYGRYAGAIRCQQQYQPGVPVGLDG